MFQRTPNSRMNAEAEPLATLGDVFSNEDGREDESNGHVDTLVLICTIFLCRASAFNKNDAVKPQGCVQHIFRETRGWYFVPKSGIASQLRKPFDDSLLF